MIGRERNNLKAEMDKWEKERIGFGLESAGAAALRLFNNDPINSLVAGMDLARKESAEDSTNIVYSPVWVC